MTDFFKHLIYSWKTCFKFNEIEIFLSSLDTREKVSKNLSNSTLRRKIANYFNTTWLNLLFWLACSKNTVKIKSQNTVWKFQDFSVTQILCEINFEVSRSSKTPVFCHFRGSGFCSFGKFQPSKNAKFHKNQNSVPLNVVHVKWLYLHFKNPQNWFHAKSVW